MPRAASSESSVQYDVYNVADPKVVDFLKDVLEEVLALFPSPVIHIGGDEVRYNQWNTFILREAIWSNNCLTTSAPLKCRPSSNIKARQAKRG